MDAHKRKLGFPKSSRLSSKKAIEELFKNGSSFYAHPFLLKFHPTTQGDIHQVLVGVPKKLHKRAVSRNLMKRRIREAFRLNQELLNPITVPHSLAILYQSKELLPFQEVQEKLITLLQRLVRKLDDNR